MSPPIASVVLNKRRTVVRLLFLLFVSATVVSADVCDDCQDAARSFLETREQAGKRKCRQQCKPSDWASANDCDRLCCRKICNTGNSDAFKACKKADYCPVPTEGPSTSPSASATSRPTPVSNPVPTEGPSPSPTSRPTTRPTPNPIPGPMQDDYHTVIVGAGAAGLAAGHTLVRQGGVDAARVKILEAQSVFGGRVKKNADAYPDFPLDMGASFIQKVPEIRGVLGDDFLERTVKPNGAARTFKGYTYWDLFDDYVVAPIEASIEYECVVASVSRGSQDVETVCQDGRTFRSKFVVITVPLPILKDGDIDFDPPLPAEMTVDHPGEMWQGLKVFMEFTRDFVSSAFCMRSLGPCLDDTGENLWWDYSFVNGGLDNGNMLLVGFLLGEQSEPYVDLSDKEILAKLANELAGRFNDNRIPGDLVGGVVENWSRNPYFRGTLSSWGYACPRYNNPDCKNNPPGAVDASSGAGRVFLAGEAFPTDSENGWVDAGAFSGDDAAVRILEIDPGLCPRGDDSFWTRLASPDQNFSDCARRLDGDDRRSASTPHQRMNFGAAAEEL